MPTNANAYNSRLTSEALEQRFRDTFTSQGGAELVDDLYASGVIVPVVDFTAAAEGSQLRQDLQTAWDFSTGNNFVRNTTTTIISNAGFWRIVLTFAGDASAAADTGSVEISDGFSTKTVWKAYGDSPGNTFFESELVVFVRSNDTVSVTSGSNNVRMQVSYRQIATLTGELTEPNGF